jgi:hypothetical protein
MKSIDQRSPRATRRRERHALAAREALAPASADLQASLPIHAMHALVVGHEAFARNQRVEAAVAIPRPDRGMGL